MHVCQNSQEAAAGAKAADQAGEGAATADEVAAAGGVQAGVGWAAAAVAVCAPGLHWCCWTQRLPCLSTTASIDF